jgi:exonuclease III
MSSSTTGVSRIRFIQVNINRQDTAYHSALQYALESKADVVLLQEPYCPKNYSTGGFIALQHSAFHTITPQPCNPSSISERPRVLAYIRKEAGIEFSTRYDLCSDPDAQVIEVLTSIEPFYIVNVYNERRLVEGSRHYTVNRLLQHLHFDLPVIIVGDFNVHHYWWNLVVSR